ncbi:aldehyde dehydrogenase family protein [Myxococcota bacterium]|nr:aldehyde dehydrogenase family protein [Myxococcota bacterium]
MTDSWETTREGTPGVHAVVSASVAMAGILGKMTEDVLRVEDPYSGERVAELPYEDAASLESKLQSATRAFALWRELPLEERITRVAQGCERFRSAADEIALNVTRQMGKPLGQAEAEVATCLDRAARSSTDAVAALTPDLLEAPEGFAFRIQHEPLGVVFDLAAWNYPLLIPVNVVVPALLAGNTVLLKHSARTPLCARAFAEAFGELGIPGLVQDVVLRHGQVRELISDPRVEHVAFTGSVEGGRDIHRAVGERFIDAGLELGGKDPAYIAEDADLEQAAAGVVDGACYNAGQSCCAVERVYVHRSRHAELLERALSLLADYELGNPLEPATNMGPLASPTAPAFLKKQVEEAVARGARLLTGGSPLDDAPRFFAPTLLDDVPNDANVMQEESFGPLVPVLAVDSDEEALSHMNDTRFGLTASIWTRENARAERLAAGLHAGTIFQNRCDYLEPSLPWTGVGDSGKGSTLSRYGFYGLTRRKALHFKRAGS